MRYKDSDRCHHASIMVLMLLHNLHILGLLNFLKIFVMIQNGFPGPENTKFGEKSEFRQEFMVFQAKFLLRIFQNHSEHKQMT